MPSSYNQIYVVGEPSPELKEKSKRNFCALFNKAVELPIKFLLYISVPNSHVQEN
jgi:hypothetical protein